MKEKIIDIKALREYLKLDEKKVKFADFLKQWKKEKNK